jgi:hypothetical protein
MSPLLFVHCGTSSITDYCKINTQPDKIDSKSYSLNDFHLPINVLVRASQIFNLNSSYMNVLQALSTKHSLGTTTGLECSISINTLRCIPNIFLALNTLLTLFMAMLIVFNVIPYLVTERILAISSCRRVYPEYHLYSRIYQSPIS